MFGDFPLLNKIVLVTGGGSGICLEFVRIANARGAKVLIADIALTKDAEDLVSVAKDVHFQRCDVRNWNDLRAVIDVSVKLWQDVPDVYVAGAGVFEPKWSNFWEDPEQTSYDQLTINASHPVKLTRLAIKALLGRDKKGVICIISSIAGIYGSYSAPLYTATKFAMVGFVRSMAPLEELEGIKVTTICPGLVKTPLWTDQPEKMVQFSIDAVDHVSPAEVGTAMASLVEDARYAGGTVLEITPHGTRVIPQWNVSPTPGAHNALTNEEAIKRNLAPIKEVLAKERASKL